ncbi:MAG: hypothetical protein PGN34_07665 [Methylobacterium frigidaeris]
MPLFFFHLRSPAGRDEDAIGVELNGVEAAYLEACHTIPFLSEELVRKGARPLRYAFEIADVGGTLLMEVPFAEVLDRGRRPVPPATAESFRKAAATMARTAELIVSIRKERVALRDTLAETKRLLAQVRQAGS